MGTREDYTDAEEGGYMAAKVSNVVPFKARLLQFLAWIGVAMVIGGLVAAVTYGSSLAALVDFGAQKSQVGEWGLGTNGGGLHLRGECEEGHLKTQSPIALVQGSAAGIATITRMDFTAYPAAGVEVKLKPTSDGFRVFPRTAGAWGTVVINGKTWTPLQYHFHAPSEHTLNGQYFDAEVHIVHKDASGNLAVIGIFLEVSGSTANAALQTMLDNTKSTTKCTDDASSLCPGVQATPLNLIPDQTNVAYRQYYNYPGSLTTAPCTEGVNWHVFTQSVAITADQLVELLKEAGSHTNYRFFIDNRETMPLNGRPVYLVTPP